MNKTSINIKKISYMFWTFFIHSLFVILGAGLSDVKVLLIISLFNMLIEIASLSSYKGNLFTLSNIFIVLSFILHISGIFFEGIFNLAVNYHFLQWTEKRLIIIVLKKYMFCMYAFWIGICVSEFLNIKIKSKKRILNADDKDLQIVAYIFLILGIIPKLIVDYKAFSIRRSSNYAMTTSNDNSGLGILAFMVYFGFIILMYLNRENKKKSIKIIMIGIVIEAFALLSGHRYNTISFWIVLFYLFIKYHANLNYRKIWKYFLLGVAAMWIVSQISFTRMDTLSVASLLKSRKFAEVIVAFFSEMGNTVRTAIYSIQYVPSPVPYGKGLTYIEFFIRLIPKSDSIFDLKETVFQLLFPNNMAIGGSWIAEVWYNFKYCSEVFVFIIGYVINKVEKNLDSSNNKWIYINFLFPIILFLREDVIVFRYSIYSLLFTYLIIKFLHIIYNSKGYEDKL